MDPKRPAETSDHGSRKKPRIDVSMKAWKETQNALHLLGEELRRKEAEVEQQQKQAAAKAEQDRETIVAQAQEIKNQKLQLDGVRDSFRQYQRRNEQSLSVVAQKQSEDEGKHASQIEALQAKLLKAQGAADRSQEFEVIKSTVNVLSSQVKDLTGTLERYRKQVQELTVSEAVLIHEKRHGLWVLERKRSILEKSHAERSDDLACLVEAMAATVKIREVTKGMQLTNMGQFGAAHAELRTALTPKVRSVLLKHSEAQAAGL
ncbi:uncharacterized protein RCC_05917 [Ramularia collo-cygni]|uniref:Uncharacterized protein n=1 Tax=Ramularia collo-cygni TaxID=112498 RepID=A0A2D3V3N1_9PEZI|nr:uncharacterized protein RCC_05917 [Ramularia collo-cygni]CZT20060.1 uncharacterized protein RCC_05917 [Ramularia collo-cygni]